MISAAPHYLLLCETKSDSATKSRQGHWTFVLEQVGSSQRIEVADCEPEVKGERLQLLAVVRGLEALEQPSRVTLFTSSRYVGHGIRCHLSTWRENGFRWERFGEMKSIKNLDLWLRIDHAMKFHTVDCRVWQFDTAAAVGKGFNEPKSLVAPESVMPQSLVARKSADRQPSWFKSTRNKCVQVSFSVARRWNKLRPHKSNPKFECALS